jgi:hypothetical protein
LIPSLLIALTIDLRHAIHVLLFVCAASLPGRLYLDTRAMCGRRIHRHTWADILALYRLMGSPVAPNDFIPRYNLAPTQRQLQ